LISTRWVLDEGSTAFANSQVGRKCSDCGASMVVRVAKKGATRMNLFGVVQLIPNAKRLSRKLKCVRAGHSRTLIMNRKSTIKYRTSEICSRLDISRATLFRWESEGLLTEVERDWRGWRIYTEANLKDFEKLMMSRVP